MFLISCQPDSKEDPTPDGGIDFTGSWNRDSVLVNDIAPNGLKVRIETEPNYGFYTFNSDKATGVLNLFGTNFAITWNYNPAAGTIKISEIDWPNQTYSITQLSTKRIRLLGYKDMGDQFQNERIIYLTKK